jgi:hypothetical protein
MSSGCFKKVGGEEKLFNGLSSYYGQRNNAVLSTEQPRSADEVVKSIRGLEVCHFSSISRPCVDMAKLTDNDENLSSVL